MFRLFSAILAGYEAVNSIIHPLSFRNIWAVIIALIIELIGNEYCSFQDKNGQGDRKRCSALIADGYRASVDGFTRLAVLFEAIGVVIGFPLAGPIIGLLITLTILKIVLQEKDLSPAVLVQLLIVKRLHMECYGVCNNRLGFCFNQALSSDLNILSISAECSRMKPGKLQMNTGL